MMIPLVKFNEKVPKVIIELRDMLLYTISRKLDIEQTKVGPDVRTHIPNNIVMYINRDDQPVFINQTIGNYPYLDGVLN